MKGKIKSWLARYLPAEISALVGVLVGGLLADKIFHNSIATALGGYGVKMPDIMEPLFSVRHEIS